MTKITSDEMRSMLYGIMREITAEITSDRMFPTSYHRKHFASRLAPYLKTRIELLEEAGRTVRPCVDWTQRVAQLLSRDPNVIKDVSYFWWGPTNTYRIDDDKNNIGYWKTL